MPCSIPEATAPSTYSTATFSMLGTSTCGGVFAGVRVTAVPLISGGAWRGGFGSATNETIDSGTLVIDIYNPAQKQLIWRGTATHTLNPSGNADKNYNNLQKAIEKLLKPFPPQLKK